MLTNSSFEMCTDTLQGLRTVTCEDGLPCKRREDARLLGDHFLQVFNEDGHKRRPKLLRGTAFPNLPGPTLQPNATLESPYAAQRWSQILPTKSSSEPFDLEEDFEM